MQKSRARLLGKVILVVGIIVFLAQTGWSQSVYLPQSYQFNQKLNRTVYSKNTSLHTSLRPFLLDSTLMPRYSELMNLGGDENKHQTWVGRKLWDEHLVDIKTKEYTMFADFLTDNLAGYDFKDKDKPATFKPVGFGLKTKLGVNTRGFQFGGTVGDKFYFYTSGYENQAVFPSYYNDYVNHIGFVPGQAYDRSFGKPQKDYSYVTAILSYAPIKQLNITLGQDKTFIGDGYRSLLLSDYAANYPLLRITANLGKIQYMAMWTYLQDIIQPKFDTFGSNRRKYGLFHYLDWNVNNSLSLGFFNAYIAPETDDQGNRRGFDVNFINPVLFASGLGPSSQPGNALAGFTGKYKIFDKTALYGQLLIDHFKLQSFFSGDNAQNTNGWQIGIRGADIFNVKNFNYLFEYNTVKPYTYSSEQPISSYTFYSEPLGDPLGANFREIIGILNYSAGRFDLQGQLNYARYGLNTAANIEGKDINQPYLSTAGNKIGQGIKTDLYYAEGTVAYIINPKYNLRFELSGLYRQEKNNLGNKKSAIITFGLRTTFRSLYHDF
ncbi:gliding motility protein RemB [Mucilaginibacter segetis]|uniref:Gliding motility protein RemB n=1 Tax=Mucilaginibacter segetis TaxID=2793071 RepID=A0A934ULY0_9SPHI|nr:gliding motility protein RemB [Mucilaginibacter segetis]MBK0378321.1 gliding motility protein RemB [Mucilaginibacter segetis]